MAELADRCRLAGAVDADHEDDMRAWKTPHLQRLGDRTEDLLDLFGEDGAKASLIELFELLLRDGLADAMRCFGPEIRSDGRFLDSVEGRRIQRGPAGEAGEIVGDAVRGLLKTAAKAVEPAHAHTAVR